MESSFALGLVQNSDWIQIQYLSFLSQAQWEEFSKPTCPANNGRGGVRNNDRKRSQCRRSQHIEKHRPKEKHKREHFCSPKKRPARTLFFFPGNSSEWYNAPQLHPAQLLGQLLYYHHSQDFQFKKNPYQRKEKSETHIRNTYVLQLQLYIKSS